MMRLFRSSKPAWSWWGTRRATTTSALLARPSKLGATRIAPWGRSSVLSCAAGKTVVSELAPLALVPRLRAGARGRPKDRGQRRVRTRSIGSESASSWAPSTSRAASLRPRPKRPAWSTSRATTVG